MQAKKTMKRIIKTAFMLVFIVVFAAMTAFAEGTAAVSSCKITDDNSKVTVKVQAEADIPTDDAVFYLFALPTYVDTLDGQAPVASVPYSGAGEHIFTVELNNNTPQSLLYSKFVVAVKAYGVYTPVTGGNFITNPEVLASSDIPLTEVDSKKGIHMTYSMISDVEELGIDHGYMNVSFAEFISNEPTENSYVYNGKTYYFKDVIKDYDNRISNLTKAGIKVSASFLNILSEHNINNGYNYLLHPGAGYNAGTMNYAINTSTQQGLETVAAAAHFLAERYNGTNEAYGKVDSWIIGNEVNDIVGYYYMGEAFTGKDKADAFVREYLQSFRVMYQAVKSAYSNANVYICLEHRWGTKDTNIDYGGKKFVDRFAEYSRAQGDMDWGLSYHPYSFPMSDADILNDGIERIPDENGDKQEAGQVKESFDSKYITMKNLNCLTDYFNRAELLNPDGEVRSIILGEQGYTSFSNITGQNEAKQAANIALAYYIAEMNEDIDAFILRGHTDEYEGSQFFKFGIWTQDSAGYPDQQKYAYNIYKYINTPDSLEYTEFAKDALNIYNWSDVVKYWDASKFEDMGTRTDAALNTVTAVSGDKSVAKAMKNEWTTGHNIYTIDHNDYTGKNYPDGVAVVNSFAYYKDFQSVEKHFSTPLDMTSNPYLVFDINFKAMDANYANDKLELQVRVRSDDDIFDASGIVNVGTDYKVCVDLSQWPSRNDIDTIEIMVKEYGKESSFAGTFTVYNTVAAASVSDQTALQSPEAEKTDISTAQLSFVKKHQVTGDKIEPEVTVTLGDKTLVREKDFDVIYHNNKEMGIAILDVVGIGDYKGWKTSEFIIYTTIYEGVDYALVYDYEYYIENNPFVVEEVGTDPAAVLAHFVTKGMGYALQANDSFNVLAYAKLNGDLAAFYGEDWKALYNHYIAFGNAEGRATSGTKPADMTAPVYPGTEPDPTPVPTPVPTPEPTPTPKPTPAPTNPPETNIRTTPMYRLYNPNSGEHFYTGSIEERDNLVTAGWAYEGVAWNAPTNSGAPVYRLYNPNSGDHHYTMSADERDMLVGYGWIYEGVAWNSATAENLPLYRLYNPNADCGSHHYTGSTEERDMLVGVGWIFEGIGWFGMLR